MAAYVAALQGGLPSITRCTVSALNQPAAGAAAAGGGAHDCRPRGGPGPGPSTAGGDWRAAAMQPGLRTLVLDSLPPGRVDAIMDTVPRLPSLRTLSLLASLGPDGWALLVPIHRRPASC